MFPNKAEPTTTLHASRAEMTRRRRQSMRAARPVRRIAPL
uniref:Uncharacterized protein n=1 Tax=Rhizobium rhizogenes TaxID=359 RepID=A0A7S4ZV16_RHIRH|nr:hypothetical protein pC6.5c_640 [Rhizobium rhizogenes]